MSTKVPISADRQAVLKVQLRRLDPVAQPRQGPKAGPAQADRELEYGCVPWFAYEQAPPTAPNRGESAGGGSA
jgi:hypothetical protein